MKLRVIAIALLIGICAQGENWPQWRGPGLNGISGEKNLPTTWDTKTNVTWKIAQPDVSGSSPILWGEHLFLSVAEGGSLWLWDIDRNTGAVRWKQKVGDGDTKARKGNMSSPSPVTDGQTVWVLTGNGYVKAFDFTGKQLWERHLTKDYGQWGLNHGYGSSPLLFRDGLYIQVLHGMKTDDPSYVLRLDTKSGRTVWKVERPTDAVVESPDSYTTPTVAYSNNKPELIITGGDYVTGHDLNTGKELWRGGGMNPRANPMNRIVASPVVQSGLIYVPTRVNPLQAYRPGGSGNVSESHLAWSTPNGPDVPTPVSDGKYLYMVNDRGIVWCFDAMTGKEIYSGQRMKPAIYSSSPVLADGKIYASNEEGLTTVFKAGPVFEVLAENHLEDYTLASPAISDGQIFLRTRGWLYCVGKRNAK